MLLLPYSSLTNFLQKIQELLSINSWAFGISILGNVPDCISHIASYYNVGLITFW